MTRITEVVCICTSCHRRTGSRLNSDKVRSILSLELVTHEGCHDTAEVRSAAGTSDNDVGILVNHLHLQLCLFTDDGLVEKYLVENGTENIAVTLCRCCDFNCLGDRASEGSCRSGMLFEDGTSDVSRCRR